MAKLPQQGPRDPPGLSPLSKLGESAISTFGTICKRILWSGCGAFVLSLALLGAAWLGGFLHNLPAAWRRISYGPRTC